MIDDEDSHTWMPPPGKHQFGGYQINKNGDFLDQLPDFSGLANDSPWPLRTVAPSINDPSPYDALGMQPYYQAVPFSFGGSYRGPTLTSDPGTIPEDTGYEGAAFSADGTASIASYHAEDRSPETKQTEELFNTLQLARSRRGSKSARGSIGGFGEKKYRCTHCGHRSSTRAEFNKHNYRHIKPHHCTVPGCARKEGFGTLNDLVRHKKSCHMEEGHGPMFACSHGECAKPNPGKPRKAFPRADNFRNHLKKLHKLEITAEDGLSKYHYWPSAEKSDYNDERDLRGIGEGPCATDLQSLSSEGMARHPSQLLNKDLLESPVQSQEQKELVDVGMIDDSAELLQAPTQPQPQPQPQLQQHHNHHTQLKDLAFSSMGPVTDDTYIHPAALTIGIYSPDSFSYPQAMPLPEMTGSTDISYPPQELNDLFPDVAETNGDHSPAASLEQNFSAVGLSQATPAVVPEDGDEAMDETGTESSFIAAPSYNAMLETGMDNSAIIKLLKTFPKELLELALRKEDEPATSSVAEEPQRDKDGPQCQWCHKVFQRPCELKKHIKRHLKPYPCTFKGCSNRRFGSKNDWKRHESSQHETADQQSQTWFCDGSCNQVRFYPTKDAFAAHITQYHGVVEVSDLHAYMSTSVFGGRQDRRFWCGFCAEVLDGGDGGSGAWTARCDHIDLHFSGKDGFDQGNMDNWRYLEDEPGMEQRKAMLESQASSSATTSVATSFSSAKSQSTATTTHLQPLPLEDRKRKGVSSPHVRQRAAKR